MLTLPSVVRIYACTTPVDFRRGFDGLATVVRDGLGRDPLSGDLFIVRNRRGDRLKILFWDRDGFWLWYKRLERGTFRFPRSDTGEIELERSELLCILEGLSPQNMRRRKRFRLMRERRACGS